MGVFTHRVQCPTQHSRLSQKRTVNQKIIIRIHRPRKIQIAIPISTKMIGKAPIDPKIIWRRRRNRRFRAIWGDAVEFVKGWCIGRLRSGEKPLKLSHFRALQSKTQSQDRQFDADTAVFGFSQGYAVPISQRS